MRILNKKYSKASVFFAGLAIYFVLAAFLYWIFYGYLFRFVPEKDKITRMLQAEELTEAAQGWVVKQKEMKISFTSNTNDPHLFFKIDEEADDLYFDIYVDSLLKGKSPIVSARGEIYYALDQNFIVEHRTEFELKKGHNIVRVPTDRIFKNIRVDLVSEKDLMVSLYGICVTNYFKIDWLFRPAAMALLLECLLLLVIYLPEKKLGERFAHCFNPVKSFVSEFRFYISKYKSVVVWTFVITIFCYGILCAYYTIYIDEERQIMESCATQSWIAQGRFGNYLFERYFLTGKIYTSFFGDALAAALLGISVLLQCFNFYVAAQKLVHRISYIIFCGIAVSVPFVCGAYMVVGIYNIEISLALCLANLSVSFIFQDRTAEKSKYCYSVILLAACICIYQAFVPFFVTNIAACCFLWVEFAEKVNVKKVWALIIKSIAVCIVALLLYFVLNKIFIWKIGGASAYLTDSFIGWGKGTSPVIIIKIMIGRIRDIVSGSSSFLLGGIIYRVTFVVFLFYVLERVVKRQEHWKLSVFLAFCSFLAPFCLNFVLGNTLFAGRTLLGLPLLLGMIWIVAVEKVSDRICIKTAIAFTAFYLILLQVQYINQYFLSDFKRYEQDQVVTAQIIGDIREACGGYTQMPIIPVGIYAYEDHGLAMHYELAGSYYTVDGGSITRIIHFMQAQGYNVDMPTEDQIADSYQHINDMPIWPVKGSVKNVNGYVIVKLSEPSQEWLNSYVVPYQ